MGRPMKSWVVPWYSNPWLNSAFKWTQTRYTSISFSEAWRQQSWGPPFRYLIKTEGTELGSTLCHFLKNAQKIHHHIPVSHPWLSGRKYNVISSCSLIKILCEEREHYMIRKLNPHQKFPSSPKERNNRKATPSLAFKSTIELNG